jgi:hypothetical protein
MSEERNMSMGCHEVMNSDGLEYNCKVIIVQPKKKMSRPRLEFPITEIRQFSLIKHLATLQIIARSGRLWCPFSIYLRHQAIFQRRTRKCIQKCFFRSGKKPDY